MRLKVDVILTAGGAVLATKAATSIIPIVFALALDPVGSSMVASWRNRAATSPACHTSDRLTSKQLELLRAVIPGLRRLAIIANASYPAAILKSNEIGDGPLLGIEVVTPEIRRAEDMGPAFEALKGRAEPFILLPTR